MSPNAPFAAVRRIATLATLVSVTFLLAAVPTGAQEEGGLSDEFNAAMGLGKTHWTNDKDVGLGLGPVDDEALGASPGRDSWLHFGGNFQTWRHSPIEELNPESIGTLRAAWATPTGVPGQLEASPIVYDGILYLTSAMNRLFALDAASGALIWRYDHQNPGDLRICCGPANRGVAIAGDLVLMATLDAKLLAFHRKSGELVWETEIDDYRKGLSATSAPLVVGDLAFIGIGGGEFGVRGYFDAYDTKTGERRWRHYTVPAEGEPGVETWAGESYKYGGAPTWVTGSYDPDSDTLFWATGNPGPDWNGDVRLGDNLYSDSVLAIDPATGERKWHFQYTPHNVWDYDGNTELWLIDVEIDGETIPAVAQANRNGYYYLLDRRDGSFLLAKQYVEQLNWASGIDSDGRPILNPEKVPAEDPTERICPGIAGGNNGAYHGAYNPDTGLAYVNSIESCMMILKGLAVYIEGVPYFGGEPVPVDMVEGKAYGNLAAIDVNTGDVRWRYRDDYPMLAGILSTAGGVVISGNASGKVFALDAETGEELWSFQTGSGIKSHPIAYEVDGRIFVAIGSGGAAVVDLATGVPPGLAQGSTLFVFELPTGE